jgi:PAS domain S-box-containing protein
VLWGDKEGTFQQELTITLKGHQIGTLKGGASLNELSTIINCLIKKEYEKKDLAVETLNTYSELTLLYHVAKEFSVRMKLEEVGRIFVESAKSNITEDTASLMVFNHKTENLELLYSSGMSSAGDFTLKPGQGIAGDVFQTGISEIVTDVIKDSRFVEGPVKVRSLICAPLVTGKKVIGVINLGTREVHQYTARDLNLLTTLASQAASAVENATLYEELQRSEKEYRSLYENAVEGIFRCTTDNRILSVNPSMSRILGYASQEELLSLIKNFTVDSFVDHDHPKKLEDILNRFSRVSGFETRLYKKDKSIIWVSINASVMQGKQGGVKYIDGSLIDITERIKREKAEREKELILHQSNEYKQLVHVLCHDLANPLSNVSGFLSLLDLDHSQYHHYAQLMKLTIENGLSIIDFVRKRSAVEEDKTVISLKRYNLKQLIDEAECVLHQRFKDKNIHLQNLVDKDHFVLVEKSSFINSVINNLFSNAIKFSFPNTGVVVQSLKESGNILIKIKDSGIGIPIDMLESLFDPSKKTNRVGTNGEKGVGFGMPLVKSFVESYGGSISIQSSSQKEHSSKHGTEVTIQLTSA